MTTNDSSTGANLETLLPEVTYWRILADGRFEATPVDYYKMRQSSIVMAREQLAQYHSLLPYIIRHSIDYSIAQGGPAYATGAYVDSTLALLNNEYVEISGATGTTYCITAAIKIAVNDAHPDQVSVTGCLATTECVNIMGQDVLLVVKKRQGSYLANKAALTARYPGWEKRMEIGENLGLKSTSLLAYIFEQHQQPSVDPEFNNVTFS